MKKLMNLMVLLLPLCATAQKEDYVWLAGYDSYVGYDSAQGLWYGNPVMDFNYSPVQIRHDSLTMNFSWTNTSYCDGTGNLLFYTNGTSIANGSGALMQNGDSLNWGSFLQYDDAFHGADGYYIKEGIYAIQSLSNANQYYILHTIIDTDDVSASALLCTLLDMSLNNGQGAVIYKNRHILTNKLRGSFGITRHGNGRDWWIVVQKRYTNCYYRILLDGTGFHVLPDSVCLGSYTSFDDADGSVKFSQDGNKLVFVTVRSGLNIFDFDRCTGDISNPIVVSYPHSFQDSAVGGSIATSASGRYLYVCLVWYVVQYDLWAVDIPGSADTIAVWDNAHLPLATAFVTAQNAPDGKIYISSGGSDSVYNVINNPEARGSLCNLVQHGVHLRDLSSGLPSFPNYRLGALQGSACDTLTGLNEAVREEKEKIIKIFPNPATTQITVDYGFTDWNKTQPDLEITNALEQTIYKQQLPMYSGFQRIDITNYTPGVYMAFIKRGDKIVATEKFVKE